MIVNKKEIGEYATVLLQSGSKTQAFMVDDLINFINK